MKFTTPATTNPIDRLRVVGHAIDRINGKLKTTGMATHAYEQNDAAPNAAYGYIVGAAIAKGRVTAVRVRAARAAPGVLGIVTFENTGKLDTGEFYVERTLAAPHVDHYHQAVALFIAKTFEQTRHTVGMVKVHYEREKGSFDLAAAKEDAVTPKAGAFGPPPQTSTRDFDGAFTRAEVRRDATYTMPDQAHCMMEPHATIARWDGEQLACFNPIQQLNWELRNLARILGIDPKQIRIVTPFIGASFGGKGTSLADCVLAALGTRLTQRAVDMGDSHFPESPSTGGQSGAASVTAGVYAACVAVRDTVARRLGFDPANAVFADGEIQDGERKAPLVAAATNADLVAKEKIEFGDLAKKTAQQTFGAHFIEVGVHAATEEMRLRRMLAICAAGRILNPKTARSQVIGAMTMGAGAALMKEMVVDARRGFFVNHDLAGYEVPLYADIPHQDMVFLNEVDPFIAPLKAKGVGELGIVGVAATIANAVHDATGICVRNYPIRFDRFLDRLPDYSTT